MRVRHHLLLTLVFLVCAPLALDGQPAAAKRPMTFVDIMELPQVQDPQLSPDGKAVLFVMSKPDWKGNRRVGHIYRINSRRHESGPADLRRARRIEAALVAGRQNHRVLARRDSDTNNQIYLLETDGGEARRLTTHATAPGGMVWAPDGKSIYFTATDAKSADEREKDRVQDDVYAFEETNFKQRHLWVSDLDWQDDEAHRPATIRSPSTTLSNDGKKVAMVRAPSPLLEHSVARRSVGDGHRRRERAGSSRRTIRDGDKRRRCRRTTRPWSSRPAPTRSSRATTTTRSSCVPAAGGDGAGAAARTPPTRSRTCNGASDGKSLFFTANMGVHNELMRVDVATQAGDAAHQAASTPSRAGAIADVGRPARVHAQHAERGRAKSTRCRRPASRRAADA